MATRPGDMDLTAVAKRQRGLIWIILLGIVANIGAFASSGVSPMLAVAGLGLYLLFQLAGLVQILRLAASLQTSIFLRIAYIVLLFIPLINLLVLLTVNGQANSVLKAAGVRVGLVGVPQSEFAKLTRGNCRGCGYDRSGLELLQGCPECGRVAQVV